jgi:hypothetical protein
MTGTIHIVVAMKPLDGTFAENALRHGVAGLNIDGTRIQGPKGDGVWGTSNATVNRDRKFNASPEMGDYRSEQHASGRWPANVVLGHKGCKMVGTKKVKVVGGNSSGKKDTRQTVGKFGFDVVAVDSHADADGKETVEAWECQDGCPVKILDEQSGVLKSGMMKSGQQRNKSKGKGGYHGNFPDEASATGTYGDSGGASRYFKQVSEMPDPEV